ncbi:hypothetical protein MYE70_10380 [Marinobacter alexandrii]|uniref:hypothetical protein n=1 Tax=Marinobacter alexandrii TaxID=2570351 RepID=UPI001FFFC58C|nr:hypothetical protein [Marinobacter alexandrii]MCK2149472.1 hypothetical protein [Marinobacter alexandrii]
MKALPPPRKAAIMSDLQRRLVLKIRCQARSLESLAEALDTTTVTVWTWAKWGPSSMSDLSAADYQWLQDRRQEYSQAQAELTARYTWPKLAEKHSVSQQLLSRWYGDLLRKPNRRAA